MRVHHLNCGTMCPFAWATGGESFVCHVLLIEHDEGLVLCDTGFGTADIETPSRIPGRQLLRPAFDRQETALMQVKKLGFSPKDVRHILLTHLDPDHAGGISDFPGAEVHLLQDEWNAAQNPPTRAEASRYVKAQWAHGPKWRTHTPDGERWEGFERVRPLEAFGDQLALIPLRGHTRGHAGIALEGEAGWMVFAGDAYFHRNEVRTDAKPAPLGVRLTQRLIAVNYAERNANVRRLRELGTRRSDVQLIPAHDARVFDQARAGA
ncbi:MAG: MBL fold metallo-hydrolase [Myxococcota bacterium]